ncbi:MAG: ATP-dependent DNA helicase RecG [Planctomycetes bacterium]|nr:ATP-dependent DNA helicase RecG [Planctomycetota bacterium]
MTFPNQPGAQATGVSRAFPVAGAPGWCNVVPAMSNLEQSVQFLKGVGPARADLLAKLNVGTLGELLFHFPRSYDDLTDLRSMDKIEAGVLQTVQGEVVEIDGKELPDGRQVAKVVISDPKGKCVAGTWFNTMMFVNKLHYGQQVTFSGKPKWYRDHWTMNHPRVQVVNEGEAKLEVVPVYPLTEGLRLENLREAMRAALEKAARDVPETLPEAARVQRAYPPVEQALWQVHFPETLPQGVHARRRFIYEEFLILQVALAVRRRGVRDRQLAPKLSTTPQIDAHIRKLYPFRLTADQDRAVAAIVKDLASDRPMQRLLQADVGAGKTAVAVYALLVAVANKHQAILMAPTEVLAQQHWQTIEKYLAHSRVRRALLTGSVAPKEREQTLNAIRAGEIDLVIGTQALIQEGVEFAKLGLVVIDEQHKFGVNQRARVKKLGVDPHYLVMTATPIPRTIALSVFGDLDTSTIKQLPPGRQRVVTRWQAETQRERVYQRFQEEMKKGRQAFIVCPLVEESEKLDLTAATELYEILRTGVFKDFRVGLLHGRLADDEKRQVMTDFRERKLDLLIATVVIEVGVDVPNATLMMIEHADRFGLSQLHQLRGRVTRGNVAGECYLFAGVTTEEARQRLRAIARTSDGFALAEEDARLRGLGEFFGTRQHGLGDLRFGDLLHDFDLLEMARADAIEIVAGDAGLRKPEHTALRHAVLARYGQTLDLAAIG